MISSGNAQVSVVDVDNFTDDKLITAVEPNCDRVIAYGNRRLNNGYLTLAKPLRAASILKCLADLEVTSSAHEFAEDHRAVEYAYHLRRWPPIDVMAEFPGAARICALLIKQVITAEHLSDLTGIELDKIKSFIGVGLADGFLVLKERTQTTTSMKRDKGHLQPLFAKLRLKFGAKA